MLNALTSIELLAGLIGGLVVAVAGVFRPRIGRVPVDVPFVGIVLTMAFSIALLAVGKLPTWVPAGCGLLLVASVATRWRAPHLWQQLALWVATTAALTGAAFVVFRYGGLQEEGWSRWLAAGLVVVTGGIACWRQFGAFVWLVAAGGVLVGVPDTEQALVLAGLLVAPTIAATMLRRNVLDPSAGVVIAGAIAWVIAAGGWSRPPAMVAVIGTYGIVGATGVLAVATWSMGTWPTRWAAVLWRGRDPVGWMRNRVDWLDRELDGWALYGHVVAAFVASRLVTQSDSVWISAIVVVGLLAGLGFVQVDPLDRRGSAPLELATDAGE